MNITGLEFLLAFADIEGLMDRPVTEVIELSIDFLNNDECMREYLNHYKLMKEYHLEDAEDWDIVWRI